MDLYSSDEDVLREKQRSSKFNEEELRLLSALIRKYKHIILNKKTGQVTPKQRDEAWQALNVEFNNDPICSVRRSVTQVNNKWDYMKRNAKKARRELVGVRNLSPLNKAAILLDTVRKIVQSVPSKIDSDSAIFRSIVMNRDRVATVNELCQNSDIKKRKFDINSPLSTPNTKTMFEDVAEKNLHWLIDRQDYNSKKSSLELEILEKKSETASLEKLKMMLEHDAQNLEIEIKHLSKRKLELEIALLEKQLSK